MTVSRRFALGALAAPLAARSASAQDRIPPVTVRRSEIIAARTLPRPRPGYPQPDDPNLLFHIQHSVNRNQIVYAARVVDGRLDPRRPVEVFWRRFNEDGRKRDLTFFERVFAYGVTTEPAGDNRYRTYIHGYRERHLIVDMEAGRPRALLEVGPRLVRVSFADVEAEDRGFIPNVKRVDVYGIDTASGEQVRERVPVNMG